MLRWVVMIIKSPQSGVTLCFPPPPRPRARPPPQWLLLLTLKPFDLNLRYLGQRKYMSGAMYWMTSVRFWRNSLKICDVFFQAQTLYWTYLRNGWSDWCEMKEMHWLDTGWTMWPRPLTPPMTLTFDFFKVEFQNSCISGIVIWLIWNKKKANQLHTELIVWSCTLNTSMALTL